MTTTSIRLTTNWQEIASGGCLIELASSGDFPPPDTALVYFGDKQPTNSSAVHRLNMDYGLSFSYGGKAKSFARASAKNNAIELVVTTTG